LEPEHRAGSPISAVLRNADFRIIWWVGTLHEFARRMELLILSWLILQVTDSYFQLGLVLVFNNLPRPLLSLFSGLLADRVSRHRILFVAQLMKTLTVAIILSVIAFDFELLRPWHVYSAIAVQGAIKSLEDPSRRTAIMDIVGERRLVNALSLDVISNTAGKMAGPLLGGVLLDTVDFAGAYLVVLAVNTLNLGMVARLRVPLQQTGRLEVSALRSLGVAIAYAVRSPMLMGLLSVTILMNALAFPVQQFIPAIGRDHLGVGATLVGLLVAAEGFGQLAGAGLMSSTRGIRFHGRFFVAGSVAVLVLTLIFAWSPWYALAFALRALGGLGQSGFSTMQSAITMLATPQGMRGRMMGLLSFCIGVGTPLGGLEIGALAAVFTIQGAISANVVVGLLSMIPVLALTPLISRPLTQPAPAVSKT
jgi:MFS family permease